MTQLATTQKANSNEKAKSLVIKMAERFGVDSEKFMTTLKSTAFKQRDGSEPTNEQMMALMRTTGSFAAFKDMKNFHNKAMEN